MSSKSHFLLAVVAMYICKYHDTHIYIYPYLHIPPYSFTAGRMARCVSIAMLMLEKWPPSHGLPPVHQAKDGGNTAATAATAAGAGDL